MGDKAKKVRTSMASRGPSSRCNTKQCAQFSNGELRDAGFKVYGNAWNLSGTKDVINGYKETDGSNDKPFNEAEYNKMNAQAAKYIYDNLNTQDLDTNKVYTVNMFHPSSTFKKRAYDESRRRTYGTHTGILSYDPGTQGGHGASKWYVTHNEGGHVKREPFSTMQYSGKNGIPTTGSYVTQISEPLENRNIFERFLDKLRSMIGLYESGGKIQKRIIRRNFLYDYK